MIKPSFSALWTNFPDHQKYPDMRSLYTWLGGTAEKNIDQQGFGENGNTCASRMSVAFNKAHSPIQSSLVSMSDTLGCADHTRIIFQVAVFRRYLLAAYGKPQIDSSTPYNDAFRGKTGIIAFSVNFLGGATGHVALWNGSTFREPGHDDYSSFVDPRNAKSKTWKGEFWEFK